MSPNRIMTFWYIACIQYKEMASTLVSSSSEVQTISHHPSIQDEILKLSKAGTTSLKNNEAAQALSMFKKAYILADGVPETQSQKMCLFNLGAAYIAMGKPKKGLKCLLKCKSKGSVEKDGDFYFNIAAAYEEMKEYSKAVKFYQRAISEYIPSETQSISDALIKLGYCSVNVGDLPSAARSFKLASHSYQKTEKTEDAAMAMREAVSYMIRSQKFSKAEVLKTLAECAQLCSGITNQDLLVYMMSHRTGILVMKRNRAMDILKGVSLPEQIQCHLTLFHSNKGAGRIPKHFTKLLDKTVHRASTTENAATSGKEIGRQLLYIGIRGYFSEEHRLSSTAMKGVSDYLIVTQNSKVLFDF
nr:tetratricopeptide repeat protein 24-like isoform X2 [Chrysemys picta bellii]